MYITLSVLIHIICFNLLWFEQRRSMMCQMCDFSRAQKTPVKENVTGFFEFLYSVGQQRLTSFVSVGSSKVQVYSKCKVTTIPALGTLYANNQKGKCLLER